MQVYISGALSGVTEEERAKLRRLYEALGALCEEVGKELGLKVSAYIPHLKSDPLHNATLTPEQVDALDRTALLESKLVVMYLGAPSLGVGIEKEIAYQAKIPVIGLCEGEKLAAGLVSRLGRAFLNEQLTYQNNKEALAMVRAALPRYYRSLARG